MNISMMMRAFAVAIALMCLIAIGCIELPDSADAAPEQAAPAFPQPGEAMYCSVNPQCLQAWCAIDDEKPYIEDPVLCYLYKVPNGSVCGGGTGQCVDGICITVRERE